MIDASPEGEDEYGRHSVSWEMPRKSCVVKMLFKVDVEEVTSISWNWEVVTDSKD
jgi:hypothetical protein